MKKLNNSVFCWESGAVGEPGREKDGDGSGDDQDGREEAVLPGFCFGVQWGKFAVASQSGKERRWSIGDIQQGETVGGGAEGGFFVGRGVDEVVEVVLT